MGGDGLSCYGGGIRTLFRYIPGQAGGTFTNASAGRSYFDANGVLQTVGANVLRDSYYIGGSRYTLLEGTRTNVCLWNRDLTNVAWTASNATVLKDQTGIDGTATSASSILATAGNATVLQAITLASSTRDQSAYVKRLVGSGTINMTTDGGTTWNVITVTAGWTQVTFSQAAVTNPSVGFRIVTNGDKIAVDYVQNENGAFQSSVVATTSAAVSRSADALSFPFAQVPQAMTGYISWLSSPASNGSGAGSPALVVGSTNSSGNRYDVWQNAALGVGGASRAAHTGTSTTPLGNAATTYSAMESMFTVDSSGNTVAVQSLLGAAATSTAATSGPANEASFANQVLRMDCRGGPAQDFQTFISKVVVASGVQSLAVMRSL